MSLIAEREVKFADIEAGFHDKLARLPNALAAVLVVLSTDPTRQVSLRTGAYA